MAQPRPLVHKHLRLRNFTVFADVGFDFVPGINVLVGENGTGKTHLMKALYAMQFSQARAERPLKSTLEDLFQTKDAADVIRLDAGIDGLAIVEGSFGDGKTWSYSVIRPVVGPDRPLGPAVLAKDPPKGERPVFIPAIDMMGHTRGFTEAYADVRLDFDLTCSDIVNLLRLEKKEPNGAEPNLGGLTEILGGDIERDDSGRFYLTMPHGRLPMPMVAEGLRKIATLLQLKRNGWLSPGTTLFWDEPEVNLNPRLMDDVVTAILSLAREGIQVFLASHSYVILREIEVQSQSTDSYRYFSLFRTDDGVKCNSANSYLAINPNAIERQYTELYDRGIDKRIKALEGKQ